jgi:hypothetical protein
VLLALASLVLGSQTTFNWVVCSADDGHIAVEIAKDGRCCPENAPRTHDPAAPGFSEERHESPCGFCADFSLPDAPKLNASHVHVSATPGLISFQTEAPAAVAPRACFVSRAARDNSPFSQQSPNLLI